jgi:prepilin-type processing-associated H-X9-DG protein
MFGTSNPGVNADGMFFRNSSIGISDVLDGTAQTIAAGERGHGLGEATWVGSVTGAVLLLAYDARVYYPRFVSSPDMILGKAGDLDTRYFSADVNQFSSLHSGGVSLYPGGVNFLFADGHVSFLKSTLDAKTFQAMATPAGGEIIPGKY